MYGYSSHSLRGVSPCSLFYSHFNIILPICRKALHHPFHWCPQNNFGVYHAYQGLFLNRCNTKKPSLIQKNRIKLMIGNSKIKYKSNTMLGVIRNLVLDFILYFVTACMRKCPINVTSAQCTTQNTVQIIWGSKQKNFYDKQFTTVGAHKPCSNLLQWKMIEPTHKVNTH